MAAPELFGRYRVVRQLGAGAFASVWLARDEQLDGPVAVKVLADNWASRGDVRERFLEEARMLRRADSDRVVRVHDIGELDDGRPYFVMTYADAGTLADRLTDSPMPVEEALWYACETARSVAVLHARGIIHRDLKPSNVLLRTVDDDREQVLVSDLGLAKGIAFASGITLAAGTPGYMPPEQAEGTGLTFASDVYALGALTYRLLAGSLPRQVSSPLSVLTTAADPVPALELADALPAGVEDILRRALSRAPGDRQVDAQEFARALAGVSGRAGAPTDVPEIARPLARHRTPGGSRSALTFATGVGADLRDASPTVVTGARSLADGEPGGLSAPPRSPARPEAWSVLDEPAGSGSGGSGSGGSGSVGAARGGHGIALATGLSVAVLVALGLVLAVLRPGLVADARAAAHGERIIRQDGFTVTVPQAWAQVASPRAPVPGGGPPGAVLLASTDVAGYATGSADGVYVGLVSGSAATVRSAATYPGCTADGVVGARVASWAGVGVRRSCGATALLTWIGTPAGGGGSPQTLFIEVRTAAGDGSALAGRVVASVVTAAR